MATTTVLHSIATLMAGAYPPVLAIGAGLGLVACVAERPGAGGPKVRSVTAITAALVVAAVVGLQGADLIVEGNAGLAWIGALTLAIPLLLIPAIALALHDASAKTNGWLHSAAASPFWSLAIGMAGLVTVGGHAGDGFLFLLAPATLLGVLAADIARAALRTPVRSNPDALQFLAPATGLATCAVCTEAVRNRRVTCSSCRAVQHKECFEFAGHCGAAGCMSTRVH